MQCCCDAKVCCADYPGITPLPCGVAQGGIAVVELEVAPSKTFLNWREKSLECRGVVPARLRQTCYFHGVVIDSNVPAPLPLLPNIRRLDLSDSAIGGSGSAYDSGSGSSGGLERLEVGVAVAAMAVPSRLSPTGLMAVVAATAVDGSAGTGGVLLFLTPTQLRNRKCSTAYSHCLLFTASTMAVCYPLLPSSRASP